MLSASFRTGLILLLVTAICHGASTTDSTTTASPAAAIASDSAQANLTSTTVPPAIIAIEIVDPTANQTVANRNTKRTIEANLGYGGQQQAPKLEYYKYSQQDIPPYNGGGAAATEIFGATSPEQPQVQQQQHPHAPGLQQVYQPGTMLFSQLNNQGQLSQLSTGPPLNTNIQQPVIVVRVRPEQLNSLAGGLYPNLPQSHPFAPNLNNVDLSSLLSGYAQNALQGQGGALQLPQTQGLEFAQPQGLGLPQQLNQFQGFPGAGALQGYDLGAAQQLAAQGAGGYDLGGAQQLAAAGLGGFDLSQAQHLAPGVANFDLGGAQQLLAAQGPQLFQQAYQQQGGFQFPAAPLAFPQAQGVAQPQPLLQQQPQQFVQHQQQQQQLVQQQPLQTFENYPDNAHTRVVFKGPAEPAVGPTPAVPEVVAEKQKEEDEEDNGENHNAEYSYSSSSSDSDGYYYEKPGTDSDDDYKPAYTNAKAKSTSFDGSSFQPNTYSDYDGEQTHQQSQQKDEREPFSYSYSTRTSHAGPKERTKKSKNSNSSNNSGSSPSASTNNGVRMRVPKSLGKSRGASRDKREKMDD